MRTLNPDYIFVRVEDDDRYNQAFSSGVVQQINAVKNNRVYPLHWSLFRNIYGEYLMLDIIRESITGENK